MLFKHMTPRESTKGGKSGCFWGRGKRKGWYCCFGNKPRATLGS